MFFLYDTSTINTATCIASSNQLTKRSYGSYEYILHCLSSSTIVLWCWTHSHLAPIRILP